MNGSDTSKQNITPVFVVIGATGGIGPELCRRLTTKGARLVMAGRDADRLQVFAEELGASPMVLDATRSEHVDQAFTRILEEYGRIDGVANCVSSLLLKPAHLTTNAEWTSTLATNLTSAFVTVRAATQAMMKTGGSIVLVSSAVARVGLANHEAVAAAKAGVLGLALSAAASYASRGIRVNCVAPGLVQTLLTPRDGEQDCPQRINGNAPIRAHRRAYGHCRRDRVVSGSRAELGHWPGAD